MLLHEEATDAQSGAAMVRCRYGAAPIPEGEPVEDRQFVRSNEFR